MAMMKSLLALLLAGALMPAPAALATDDDFDHDIERNVEDRDPRRLDTQDVSGTGTIMRATDEDYDGNDYNDGNQRNVEDRDPRRLKTRQRRSTDDDVNVGYVR
jgi:hypothetical protein